MICKQCNKDFHYGPCCGCEPEMALGFCTSTCLEQYINTNELTDKQLAGVFYSNYDCLAMVIRDKVILKKEIIGCEIVDMLLKDLVYTKEYEL